MPAKTFDLTNSQYYLDRDQWLAINPDRHQSAKATRAFPYPSGTYHVTLQAVGESDGKSTYQVTIGDETIGEFTCPLSQDTYEEGPAFHKTWKAIQIAKGAMIAVQSQIASEDGQEHSRARWAAITLEPADEETRELAKPFLAKQAAAVSQPAPARPSPPTVQRALPVLSRWSNRDNPVVTGRWR